MFSDEKEAEAPIKPSVLHFNKISVLARNIPGYIQELCDTLWDETNRNETIANASLQCALANIFAREQDHYEIFVRRLTALQTRVLRTLAARGENGVYSSQSLAMAQVYNSASMKRAIEKLVKDGLVYNFEGDYRFTNPFFREWLIRG